MQETQTFEGKPLKELQSQPSWWSIITWSWMINIIGLKKKNKLTIDNIPTNFTNMSSFDLGKQISLTIMKRKDRKLSSVIYITFWKQFLLVLLSAPLMCVSDMFFPLALKASQEILNPSKFYHCKEFSTLFTISKMSPLEIIQTVFGQYYCYIIGIIISLLFRIFGESLVSYLCSKCSIQVTSGLLDIIFNKILKISDTTKQINAAGSLANILFTDTYKIQSYIRIIYMALVLVISLIISIGFLAGIVSPVSLIGIAVIPILVPCLMLLIRVLAKNLGKMSVMRDNRSNKINEILNAIKVIKLFNYEQYQYQKVQNVRKIELSFANIANIVTTFQFTLADSAATIMMAVALGFMWHQKNIDFNALFIMFYLYQNLRGVIGFLPNFLFSIADANIAYKRIQAFLNLPNCDLSLISKQQEQDYAIEIIKQNDYCYGLQEDHNVVPELDSQFEVKAKKMREIQKQLLHPIFNGLTPLDLLSLETKQLFEKEHLPAVSSFYDVKVYDPKLFNRNNPIQVRLEYSILHFHQLKWNTVNKVEIKPSLKNLNLKIKHGSLVGIKGTVGSGKSSIFNAILGEMKIIGRNVKQEDYQKYDYFGSEPTYSNDSTIIIDGIIAFCPQSSPIFSNSIRDNIIFFNSYDKQRYDHICDICCLYPDFEQMKYGDETIVGSRGVTLSGGQRARICLARAIYSNADIFLLDDPLSAVDAHVGRRIWNEVILGYLKQNGKTVLVASHQTQWFKDCDQVIKINDGQIITVKEEKQNDQEQTETKTDTISQQQQQVIQGPKQHQKQQTQNKTISTDKGSISVMTYIKYFNSGSLLYLFSAIILLLLGQAAQQYQQAVLQHWIENKYGWSEQSVEITDIRFYNSLEIIIKEQGTNDNLVILQRAAAFCYYNVTNTEAPTFMNTSNKYILLYGCLTIAIMIIKWIAFFSFVRFAMKAANNIYGKQLLCLLRTHIRFFDTTPQGQIINRLVKDTDQLDFLQIKNFIVAGMSLSNVIAMMLFIAVICWPSIIIILIVLVLFVWFYSIFRKIAPDLRRFDAESRANVFSVCQEVIDQLTFIRASNTGEQFKLKFRRAISKNINLQWVAMSSSRWLAFWIQILSSCFIILITIFAFLTAALSESIASFSGMLVVYGFSISLFMYMVVDSISNVENEMPVIERLFDFTRLEDEEKADNEQREKNRKLSQNNQNARGLIIKNLSMRYRPELPLALNGVDVVIGDKVHVAIIGRTGSGKSSLSTTLFRLYQPELGFNIKLDDQFLSQMPLYQAREQIAIIPQEPYLFSGTLRSQLCQYTRNKQEQLSTTGLDPISDETIWDLLEIVQMKSYIQKQAGQLDCEVVGNGDNFSIGQRQLICCIRAFVKQVKLVVLDEATAFVDKETDDIIQQLIKEKFAEVTVISIAHRLETVLYMDHVLVMDAGKVNQYGKRDELAKQPGIFRELIFQAGLQDRFNLDQ